MEGIFDSIRNKWVEKTPEESVRQEVIACLVQLQYPPSLIQVEIDLRSFPHLQMHPNVPNRRVDVVCFAKDIHPQHALFPLLAIECKAKKIGKQAVKQLLGYNVYLQAPFFCIAEGGFYTTYWKDFCSKEFSSCEYIPAYEALLLSLKN